MLPIVARSTNQPPLSYPIVDTGSRIFKLLFRVAGGALALLLVFAFAAPYLTPASYGQRLRYSLERALGRRVQLGAVHLGLFPGPGLSVDSITIFEDPSIGIEPVAYIQEDSGTLRVMPALWPLLRGRFVIGSIRLEGASINLTKADAAGGPGRWNFASIISPAVMRNAPAIHVRNSRINFKFDDTKSVFYLTDTDLDVSTPTSRTGAWKLYLSAKPARTDRSAQGLGWFTLRGRWWVAPERVDMNLEIDRTAIGELTALIRGQEAGLHGTMSTSLHLAGPINGIGIEGRVRIEDVHRWDLLPPHGQGWPIDVRGRLNLPGQSVELQSWSAANTTPPLSVRFRASDYLGQPRWAVSVNWNRFPIEPLMGLATHMGAQFPPKLKLSGTMDGAVGYSTGETFQGQLAFHEAALTIPDSPPVRFEEAYLIVDHGHVRLSPALVHPDDEDTARMEADYDMQQEALDLTISTEGMKVSSLRAQGGLAAVPWLDQIASGRWSGELHHHRDAQSAAWNGNVQISDARIAVPGLADPIELRAAHAEIDGPRVSLDHIEADAGKSAFTGEYSYDPEAIRPHHLRLRAEELNAADLETEFLPTLRRSSGLIARALGRTGLPEWMVGREVEGSVQIGDLAIRGSHLRRIRARVLWDVGRVELDNLQGTLDDAAISGRLAINLRGSRPVYRFIGKVKSLSWQSGKVDAEGTLETSGTGLELLANLKSEAKFTSASLDFGAAPAWHNVSGACELAWSPRLQLTSLSLKTDEDTYTGHGAAQGDGSLLILLTNGAKEMRMTGSLAKLKVEDAR